MDAGSYKLNLVGAFGLRAPDGRRIEITSKKAMALLALVASTPGGERSRKWLQAMLWGTREEALAQSSLRRELSTLAKVLEAHDASDLMVRNTQRVGIDLARIEVDLHRLGTRLSSGEAGGEGEFLEGLDLRDCEEFEDWLRDERERVRDVLARRFPEPAAPPPGAREILGMDPPSTQEFLSNEAPRLPPKPSVAVLPLEEIGGQGGGWLGIGIADEIGVILSQFPQLFIVASSSARSLAGQDIARQEVARRLGVRYLLEGTVMQHADRVRVSVFLIDGKTGEQVWAETFGGAMADIFELQKEIASRIAPQIWTKVDIEERRWSLRRAGPPSDKYEAYWRANALFRSWERDAVAEATAIAEQMVAEDPVCPWATSMAAYCHAVAYMLGYADEREGSLRKALGHYQAAIRHGEDNVEALGYAAGTLLCIGGDLDMADRLIAHSLSLLPAHQPTLFWGGWVDVGLGNADRARERFELALRINPATGTRAQTLAGLGIAALQQGKVDEAYSILKEAVEPGSGFVIADVGLCVAATLLGDHATAHRAARSFSGGRGEPMVIGLFRKEEHRDLLRSVLQQAGAIAA